MASISQIANERHREFRREAKRPSERLPANPEVERYLLGSMMVDPDCVSDVVASVKPDDFSEVKHQIIYRRVFDLNQRGHHIDSVTLGNELLEHHELESVDGVSYLVSLTDGVPQRPLAASYIRILLQHAARRRAAFGLHHLLNRALDSTDSLEQIQDAGRALFEEIPATSGKIRLVDNIPELEDFAEEEVTYIRPELPMGEVVAFAGDSGSGKSTLALAWARDAWVEKGIRTLILDRENKLRAMKKRRKRLRITGEISKAIKHWGRWNDDDPPPLPHDPRIIAWVKSCAINRLIIMDSLSAFFEGDQNDPTAMRAFFNRCDRVAYLGATVIIIHHIGRGDKNQDYRGSSDFKAAPDSGYTVTNEGPNAMLDKLTLKPLKPQRERDDGDSSGDIIYLYDHGRFTRGDAHDGTDAKKERLISILRTHPRCTATKFDELATKAGIDRRWARQWRDTARLAGDVEREVKGKTQRFSLNPERFNGC